MDPATLLIAGGALLLLKGKGPSREAVSVPVVRLGPGGESPYVLQPATLGPTPAPSTWTAPPTAPVAPSLGDALKTTAVGVGKQVLGAGIRKYAAPVAIAGAKAVATKLGIAGLGKGVGALAPALGTAALIAAPVAVYGAIVYSQLARKKRRKEEFRERRRYWGNTMLQWDKATALQAARDFGLGTYRKPVGIWAEGAVYESIQVWTNPAGAKYDPEVAAAFVTATGQKRKLQTFETAGEIAAKIKRKKVERGRDAPRRPAPGISYAMAQKYKEAPTLALAKQIIAERPGQRPKRIGRD